MLKMVCTLYCIPSQTSRAASFEQHNCQCCCVATLHVQSCFAPAGSAQTDAGSWQGGCKPKGGIHGLTGLWSSVACHAPVPDLHSWYVRRPVACTKWQPLHAFYHALQGSMQGKPSGRLPCAHTIARPDGSCPAPLDLCNGTNVCHLCSGTHFRDNLTVNMRGKRGSGKHVNNTATSSPDLVPPFQVPLLPS